MAEASHPSSYLVRLPFLAFSPKGTHIADAFFNVSALISNFTVPSSTEFPVIKEFFLKIAIGNVEHAAPPLWTENGYYFGLLSKAFKTVYRINVGGQEVNDSVWRNWVPDDDYLVFRDSSVTNLVNLQWPEE
ncbi:hypothetical protein NC652_008189 [Populus alba x Populus x berolinensis]|nr:hypothetical protein NC652_008189 [Populus alba x Populus x berolinensis]